MSELIERQATIDAVNNAFDRETLLTGFVRSIAVRAIRDMPSVQPETQWIPVSERLPEDYVDVLVWFEYFRYGDYNCLYQTHGIGTYVANYNSWTINHESGWKDLRVIAWMPLPKPYEGEGKQE